MYLKYKNIFLFSDLHIYHKNIFIYEFYSRILIWKKIWIKEFDEYLFLIEDIKKVFKNKKINKIFYSFLTESERIWIKYKKKWNIVYFFNILYDYFIKFDRQYEKLIEEISFYINIKKIEKLINKFNKIINDKKFLFYYWEKLIDYILKMLKKESWNIQNIINWWDFIFNLWDWKIKDIEWYKNWIIFKKIKKISKYWTHYLVVWNHDVKKNKKIEKIKNFYEKLWIKLIDFYILKGNKYNVIFTHYPLLNDDIKKNFYFSNIENEILNTYANKNILNYHWHTHSLDFWKINSNNRFWINYFNFCIDYLI